MPQKKTIVYVDGFNLYYNCLKNTGYKWLDLLKLFQILIPQNHIIQIKYFTAAVSSKTGPSSPQRQKTYLNALSSIACLQVIKGNFLVSEKFAPVVIEKNIPVFRPIPNSCAINPPPEMVKIRKTEEKGSDVNIAVHMIHDAHKGECEASVIVSNDTDFVEVMRILREEIGMIVGLISPAASAHSSLKEQATFIKHIRTEHLKRAQFPDHFTLPDGRIVQKPQEWYGRAKG